MASELDKIRSKLQEGMELEYEATSRQITIVIEFSEESRFKELNSVLDQISLDLIKTGYVITYDNTRSTVIHKVMKHHRYVSFSMKKEKEAVNA